MIQWALFFDKFLDDIGLTDASALLDHSLAPLGMRRDIAMLGLLHKVSLGAAAQPIQNMFAPRRGSLDCFGIGSTFPRHCRQLHDPVAFFHAPIIHRSIFGLIKVYNQLPFDVLDSKTPKHFQHHLQRSAKNAARAGQQSWQLMFSAR